MENIYIVQSDEFLNFSIIAYKVYLVARIEFKCYDSDIHFRVIKLLMGN